MMAKSIFISYQEIKHNKPSGQIAALITLIIAVIFLFIAVTINIGKVSRVRTATQIAADGAALNIASNLGSAAHNYKETTLNGKEKDCAWNWWLILVPIGIIFFWPLAVVATVYVGIANAAYVRALDRQFAKMTAKAKYQQAAIQYALFRTVDDPQMVQDTHDYDEDGKTDDLIPRFQAWYSRRVLDIADRCETLDYYISLILPQLRRLDEALGKCHIYAAGNEEDDPLYPEGTEFKKWLKDIEDGMGYNNAELSLKDPQKDPLEPDNIVVTVYSETIKTDFPFWEEGKYNDELDYFVTLCKGFDAWAWGVSVNEEDPNTGEIKRVFYPGIINMSTTALRDTFYSWYGRLLVWDADFNAYMYPIRCWVKCYWGFKDRKCDADCSYAEVHLIKNGEETIIQNDLRDVFLGKIEEMRNKQDDLTTKYKKLEEAMKKITDPGEKKKYEDKLEELKAAIKVLDDSIALLDGHIAKIDTAGKKFGDARGAIYGLEVFLHGDSEAEPPTTGIGPEIQQALAALADLNKATYSWQDSLGWHHLKAEVSEFKIPTVNSYTTWYGSTCGELLNARGKVTVKVTRYDQDKDVKLSSGASLWNFRMRSNPQEAANFDPQDPEAALARGITSSATASYGPDDGEIKITAVK